MTITATQHFAQLLQKYDIDTVFGIVGIPIVQLADTMVANGIKFIPCRNEQAASYAASAYGYVSDRPGVLLIVGGPGLIHSLAGIYNSMNNRWPLLVIAGSSSQSDIYKGGFQELDQISLLSPFLKFTGKLTPDNIDMVTQKALNHCIQGTTGVSYIDFPADLIETETPLGGNNHLGNELPMILTSNRCGPDPSKIKEIAQLILQHIDKNILVVIGKGAVKNSHEIRGLINKYNLPFLPTPMAKGIVPDSSPLNVSSARSQALKTADIVLVLGARLNWILHFGSSPKWSAKSIFIQIDSHPETLGDNIASPGAGLSVWGDIGLSVTALMGELAQQDPLWKYGGVNQAMWEKIKLNQTRLREKEQVAGAQLNYHQVYGTLRPLIDDYRTILVTEGANTMDIARVSFPTDAPRHRLDAGTNATMGVGLGYALASKASHPELDVVLVQGDSAFGFSAMEIETAARCQLALVIVVMNNSGIYHGEKDVGHDLPPTALSKNCRYDLVGKGLGAHGFFVNTLGELSKSFQRAVQLSRTKRETSVINVIIEPGEQKKIAFAWQNKPRL
ncbi:YEL020C [Saccharomyces arboricola H-6]|uniref:2-hydroxyacyl-CoA lyase n=1 Tax=Saccharomyces arboricola (strain H-6 / AS 2.3317 / CBS 10644) TaxID=1160507 RepID=J8LPQ5_SACAR|nr:YEL020C [Saccharomyces arboricola H-6]